MTLIILAGVWALAFGHITLTNNLRMKDNEARIFGAVLIVVAAYGFPHLSGFAEAYIPKLVASNDAFKSAWDLLLGAFATYATGYILTRMILRMRVPSISVSFKRLRA